jgi:hypothetical protein
MGPFRDARSSLFCMRNPRMFEIEGPLANAASPLVAWFETREDALLTMRVQDLILRSALLRASRRMKPLKWKLR